MSAYVLLVEDEPDISALVAFHLARESYRVRTAADGTEALSIIERERPDLVVLDLLLPGLQGLEVLRQLREQPETRSIPVIILTARKAEEDRIEGLRLGADDYVSKPFSPQELVLRVGAVLRRVHQPPPSAVADIMRAGPLRIDTAAAIAELDGQQLRLTPTEYRLLLVLAERRGRVQSRDQLLEAVWDLKEDVTTRTVDMHVQRLRSKLGPHADYIETVRGFGYRFRGEVSA